MTSNKIYTFNGLLFHAISHSGIHIVANDDSSIIHLRSVGTQHQPIEDFFCTVVLFEANTCNEIVHTL